MDQNQTTTNPSVDDDLQKAIDNITNTTNIDPVFSDPVAAPSSVPENDSGELAEPVGPFPGAEVNLPAPEPVAPLDAMAAMPELTPPTAEVTNDNLSMRQIKESALRDLVPLLEYLNLNASQKFNLYRNIFESLRDYTILNRAYAAAKEISDDSERAEALLYLVESIDKM